MKGREHVKRDTRGRGGRKKEENREEKKKGKLKLVAVRFHQDQSTKTERPRETAGDPRTGCGFLLLAGRGKAGAGKNAGRSW